MIITVKILLKSGAGISSDVSIFNDDVGLQIDHNNDMESFRDSKHGAIPRDFFFLMRTANNEKNDNLVVS